MIYLILNRNRIVAAQELYGVLWPNEESRNPQSALKTLIHRLRNTFVLSGAPESALFIKSRPGGYRWEPQVKCEIDTEEFEKAAEEAFGKSGDLESSEKALLNVIGIYRGRFLSGDNELWKAEFDEFYHGLYIRAVKRLSDIYCKEERYNDAYNLCIKAAAFDETDEYLNRTVILSLAKSGNVDKAISYYNNITDMYYSKYGIKVPESIQAIYSGFADLSNSVYGIDELMELIGESDRQQGAYCCCYEVFREIYQIEVRCMERYGGRVFAGLISLRSPQEDVPETRVLNRNMGRLETVIKNSLRRGDIMSRCSPSQFMVILPTVTEETGHKVLERIQKNFRRQYPKVGLQVYYSLRPLTYNK